MSVPTCLVGIDWAQDFHEVCVLEPDGSGQLERTVKHTATALDEFCRWLSARADGDNGSVFVAIEVPHGPVVETLLDRGFTVFSINPKQLDRFRDRFSVAGAKDDRLDALVLADTLRTDRRHYRRLVPLDPTTVELREWSRMHEDAKHDVNRVSNRMREQLRRYFPQLLEVGDVTERWILDLWEKAPTPERAGRLRVATVAKILKRRRIRRLTADEVVEVLRQPAFRVAPGTAEAAAAHIGLLLPQLRLALGQRSECEKQLGRILDAMASSDDTEGERSEQCDVAIMLSFPGLGIINVAALLAEAWQAIAARDYHALRSYTGQAPVTRRSGKRLHVVFMRQACNDRLRDTMYHWARVAAQVDPYCKAQYAALRLRGHGHARALRTVGDRLLAALCAALRAGTAYDPALRRGRRAA